MTDFTGTLGVAPDDVAISPDGSLIYAAGAWTNPSSPVPVNDGNLRIYNAATGALVDTIHLGTRLGAIDLSPDGTFLLVTELAPVSGLATLYKVDLATHAAQTINYTLLPGENGEAPFYDVAILSNGTVLLSLANGLTGGGGGATKLLDLATGTFANGPNFATPGSFLTPSADGSEVLIGGQWVGNAPLSIYQPGTGLSANNDQYYPGTVIGPNSGAQAIDPVSGTVAQFVYNNGLHIYDERLHYQINISSLYPSTPTAPPAPPPPPPIFSSDVAALAFDGTGQYLFVLDGRTNRILELSTLNWAIVGAIDVGAQAAGGADLGGRLQVAPDSSYFTVVTTSGLVKIANPGIAPTIAATSGDDTLSGTSGDDIVSGLGGNDIIDGGAGRDVLSGGDGNDTITGGDGDDAISGGAGDDLLDGGTGNDTASYADALSGVAVNLSLTTAQDTHGAGIDALQNIENLYGSPFGDTLLGDAAANILRGQAGDDVLVGGAGRDELNGGAGFDTVDYSQESGGGNVVVNLRQSTTVDASGQVGPYQARDTYGNVDSISSIEHVITGAGNDSVFGSAVTERIETGAGNDILNSGGGGDTLIGGTGNDTYVVSAGDIVIELVNEGTDRVQTGLATYVLPANIENLTGTNAAGQFLTGNELDNVISGSAGNDTLVGGAGNDRLSGGAGDDTIDGGDGIDTASYSNPTGAVNVSLAISGSQDTGAAGIDTLVSIENLNGSAFNDTLAGNSGSNVLNGLGGDDIVIGGAGADTLTGGDGNDTFKDTAAGLNGDTITDFSRGDRIVITDANIANFSFSLSGNTLTLTGGSLTLSNIPAGHLVAAAAAGGGVQLTVVSRPAHNDFDGDGKSDILWRGADGMVTDWLGQANGSFSGNWYAFHNALANSWHVAGTGDFNGDGKSDILWRGDDGTTTNWLGTANGSFVGNWDAVHANPGTNWQVAGTGDFDGDGKSDILWRATDGTVTDWLGTANGGFSGNWDNFHNSPGTSWHVAGTGDFNGDGKTDILWRADDGTTTNWLGTANGGFVGNWDAFHGNPGTNWQVAGTGDFNGDGKSDILWRATDGTTTNWLGTANGGFVGNWDAFHTNLGTSWHLASTGDYNGDGMDDLLWRADDGGVTNWLGTASGGFTGNWDNFHTNPGTTWHVEDPFVHDYFV